MNDFVRGDIVRCVDSGPASSPLARGELYLIIRPERGFVYVEGLEKHTQKDIAGKHGGWLATRFKLHAKAPVELSQEAYDDALEAQEIFDKLREK